MSVELQPVNMQNLDDPTFTTLKQQKERRLQISTEPEVKMATTPQNRLQLSERKQPTWQTNKSQDRRMAKSPSNGMVPLAKKFSAFPASNRNQATRNALTFSNPGLISGGTSRNYTDVSASQKGPQGAALANRSFTNFTQQFHGGSLAQVKTGKSHAAMKLSQSNFLSAKQLVASRENSISNESCELSPDQETSNKRRLLGDDDDPTMREEIDADSLSMINPLVTPGPEDNRCSNFQEFKKHSPQKPMYFDEEEAKASRVTLKRKTIKLNNPYDELTIVKSLRMDNNPGHESEEESNKVSSRVK